VAAGPFPTRGRFPPAPDRLGGELSAGADVDLGLIRARLRSAVISLIWL